MVVAFVVAFVVVVAFDVVVAFAVVVDIPVGHRFLFRQCLAVVQNNNTFFQSLFVVQFHCIVYVDCMDFHIDLHCQVVCIYKCLDICN